ncbi:hypothetical protein Peur_044134 [Populus x canadensis]|jgi:uncharacterized membrane protein
MAVAIILITVVILIVISIFVWAASGYRKGIDAGENNQEKKDEKTREDGASIDAGENHQEKKDEKIHTVEVNISCCGDGCGGD